ncbi:MAG TPA: helix-turn-helix transcriptional regulator [Pseudonocardiaceae bacterium]|jgi:transcriptional regulator with XRE-family HTH domain|nr:helix-turn-helix transcriptional regulator [Pseudonocardiaceae bacterium]
MPSIQGPVMPRKRIATELRRLRDEANLTLEQVAGDLLISTSKLSRLENAQGSPQARDVRDLINYYQIADTELAAKLTRWVRAAHRQGWWNEYSDAMAPDLDTHIAYETEAAVTRVYAIPALPVLLQTVDYSRVYYQNTEPWRTPSEIDMLIQLRRGRQAALDHRDDQHPLRLVAVIHESGLHQLMGTPEIMHAQLGHLVERSTAPNIDLHVLPFSAALPFTSTCTYAYFEFSDALDRDVVAIETHAGFRYIEATKTVAQYRRHYENVLDHSLSSEDTRGLIRSIQPRYRG